MTSWQNVGDWIKSNAGTGAALVGSLLTGNVPGAVAAGVSLISVATGTSEPQEALRQLQTDPATILRLKELAVQEQASIRLHLEKMESLRLADEQAAHHEQQETIRAGDNVEDPYVRHTRPLMARQSWYATVGYVVGFELLKALDVIQTGAVLELAMLLVAPAGAYIGFRSMDKRALIK